MRRSALLFYLLLSPTSMVSTSWAQEPAPVTAAPAPTPAPAPAPATPTPTPTPAAAPIAAPPAGDGTAAAAAPIAAPPPSGDGKAAAGAAPEPFPSTPGAPQGSVLPYTGAPLRHVEESSQGQFLSLELEDLLNVKVSSTGFFETESKTTTGQARIYDARLLKLYGVRSLDDLLQAHQPGVVIGEHDRTSRLIGVRGVLIDNNAKTLVLHDGVTTNMRAHFGAIGSTLAVPLTGDIEKVEVILGPGAIVHGSGAISGFVNVLRPTGITRPGLWGKASYASGDTRTLEASYGGLLSEKHNADYFLYFGYADNEGEEPPAPRTNTGDIYGPGFAGVTTSPFLHHTRVNALGEPVYKGFGRFRYGSERSLVNVDLRLDYAQTSMMGNAPNRKTTLDEAKGQWADSNNGHVRTRSAAVTPEIHVRLSEAHKIELTPTLSAFETTLVPADWLVREVERQPGAVDGEGSISTAGFGEEHRDLKVVYKTTALPHSQLALGASASHKRFDGHRSRWGRLHGIAFESPERFSWTELAVFGENTVTFRDLTLSAGLRFDHTSFGELRLRSNNEDLSREIEPVSSPSYRVAAAYAISDTQNVKLSYQTGFRFPDAAYFNWLEQYNAAFEDEPIAPLPSLRPESSRLAEIDYFMGLFDRRLALDVSAFYARYEDTLGWVSWSDVRPDDYEDHVAGNPRHPSSGDWWGSFTNSTTDVNAVGGEIGVLGDLGGGFAGDVWYNVTKPFGAEGLINLLTSWDAETWANYPIHLVKGHLSYTALRFTAGVAATFRTGMNSHGTREAPADDSEDLSPRDRLYARSALNLDASVSFSPLEHVWVSVFGKNLTFNKVPPPSYASHRLILTTGHPYVGASAEVAY
ncbi:TonB-dependent receptor [Sorangium sp. So ce1153]|uniref:TonB-dependent receptor n=1 Tax=Sorangium sp. So ce1153 TaxID=3133333 RepID=UPI003F608CB1